MGGHVFIATSLDGRIATPDGGVEWLDVPEPPVGPDGTPDDAGWRDFIDGVDALVMGRNSFEKVLSFDVPWPYEIPVVVLSSVLEAVPDELAGRVEISSLGPADLVAHLAERGWRELYVDGGSVISSFLAAGLIDSLTVTQLPVILGPGIPLFGDEIDTTWLELLSSRSLSNGMVQTRYRVTGPPS